MSLRQTNTAPVLASTITCHAWNHDRSMIAVSPNSRDIIIYRTNGSEDLDKWEAMYTLYEHDHLVTAIDWAPKTNRILSCSQDRNAYVWSLDKASDTWKPTLVLLRINRAATCCKWSPDENKFAVGSGAKLVMVCYFEEENNWWVAKMIKKPIKSTVLAVAWDPKDNSTLAVASADFKCRLFSAWIKNVDSKESKKTEFAELLPGTSEWSAKGWVHDVRFSPSGQRLAFIGHDCSLNVVDRSKDGEQVSLYTGDLPYRSMLFTSEGSIVAAGYDYTPVGFCESGGAWKNCGQADRGDAAKSAGASSTGVRSAFQKFQTVSTMGSANAAGADSREPKTRHKNAIQEIAPFKADASGKVSKFTTCALDGRVLFWDMSDLTKSLDGFTQA